MKEKRVNSTAHIIYYYWKSSLLDCTVNRTNNTNGKTSKDNWNNKFISFSFNPKRCSRRCLEIALISNHVVWSIKHFWWFCLKRSRKRRKRKEKEKKEGKEVGVGGGKLDYFASLICVLVQWENNNNKQITWAKIRSLTIACIIIFIWCITIRISWSKNRHIHHYPKPRRSSVNEKDL